MGMQAWGPSLLSAMVQWPVGDWEARGMTALSFTHSSTLQILAKRQEPEGVRLALEGQCAV